MTILSKSDIKQYFYSTSILYISLFHSGCPPGMFEGGDPKGVVVLGFLPQEKTIQNFTFECLRWPILTATSYHAYRASEGKHSQQSNIHYKPALTSSICTSFISSMDYTVLIVLQCHLNAM